MSNRKNLLAAALGATVCLSAQAALGQQIVADEYGNKIWKFSRANFCLALNGADRLAHLEKRGGNPEGGMRSWEAYWLLRFQTLEKKGVADVPIVERAQAYVDYIVKVRSSHGLPDLPGHPSEDVKAEVLCSSFGPPTPPDPGPGVSTAPEGRIQETVMETAEAYPEEAARNRIDGWVYLECDVDTDGRLHDCVVADETPARHGFGAAALKLSTKTQMWPATKDGKPIRARIRRGYHFMPGMLRLRPQ